MVMEMSIENGPGDLERHSWHQVRPSASGLLKGVSLPESAGCPPRARRSVTGCLVHVELTVTPCLPWTWKRLTRVRAAETETFLIAVLNFS